MSPPAEPDMDFPEEEEDEGVDGSGYLSDYLRARSLHLKAFEVVLKGVPAELTPERIRKFLVMVWLVKRGKPPFKEGYGFHRVQDLVTGMDMDKVKGLLVQHENDPYRWRHFILDPAMNGKKLLLHFPSLNCDYCNGHHMTHYHDDYVTDRQANIAKWNLTVKRIHEVNAAASLKVTYSQEAILLDPALVLTSTGGSREEWICVLEAYGKAHSNNLELAAAHVASVHHTTNLTTAGAATRISKGAINVTALKEEFLK
ncbi:unnamed protein product [Closterium sp. Naga37s-1]|nr:unnamed protein product [Closterium sp. Naga37s-1]